MPKAKVIVVCVLAVLLAGSYGALLYLKPDSGDSSTRFSKNKIKSLLPPDAEVIEIEDLPEKDAPDRSVVLWMINPIAHASETYQNGLGSCFYMGDTYLTGPTRVSLVDRKNARIINTLEVAPFNREKDDSFLLPSRILKVRWLEYFGKEDASTADTEKTKAKIIWLDDYTGDGHKLEFPFVYRGGCMHVESALAGYSMNQDKIIFFPVNGSIWNLYAFIGGPSYTALRKTRSLDYRGRGGCLTHYTITFDPRSEKFTESSENEDCF